jgi:preprotein translocase subunit SecE
MEEGEVAESKRHGGDDAVDERLDGAFDDAVDDDTQDDYADDIDGEPVSRSSRSAAATRDRVAAPKKTTTGKSVKSAKSGTIDESLGLFGRIARFVREVVAELRKVNWPSRNELITYTLVVLIFVVVMMSIVAGLDYGFAWAVGKVFGGK